MTTPDHPEVTDASAAWQELLTEAQDKPWLLAWLRRDGARLYTDFLAQYRRLLGQPRHTRRHLQRRLGLTLAGAALLLALTGVGLNPRPAFANAITVNGACTLANAITAANTDTATGGCTAGNGADILTITNDITLTSAPPAITSVITIEGEGHLIAGNHTFGILTVNAGANLTLNQVTISSGSATYGGGLTNFGMLTVQNCSLSGNTATFAGGGIHNYLGTATVQNSTLSGNSAHYGGGVTNWGGVLTMQNSVLSDNSAGSFGGGGGGGISNSGTLTVQSSTISGNSAEINGGGIDSFRGILTVQKSTLSANSATYGGGIANEGTVTLQNCTISGNSAGNFGPGGSAGGGITNGGTVTVRNSTISDNFAPGGGGGIAQGGMASTLVQNSIVANQTVGGDCASAVTTQGYNIESGTSCGFTETGDQQNTNPLLEALADNGGPTQTRAVKSGSPALDASPNVGCPATDQRSAARPVDVEASGPSGFTCDIGAYEFRAFTLAPTVTEPGDEVTLSWYPLPVSKYQVWRSISPYDGFTLLQDDITTTSFAVGIDPNANYYYQVHAVGDPGGDPLAISPPIGVFSFGLTPGS